MKRHLLRSLQAPEEQNQESDHARQNCGKLCRSNDLIRLNELHSSPGRFNVESEGHEYHAGQARGNGEDPDATPKEPVPVRGSHGATMSILPDFPINVAMC